MTREEAIKKAIENFEWAIYADNRSDISLMDMRMAISALKEQPVVHGQWNPHYEHDFVSDEDVLCGFHCSLCGLYYTKRHNYCPNCGARMDGDGND